MLETVLCPQINAQQNFRIFWVGMHSRGNVDYILWRAIKSKHIKYFSSMPNVDSKDALFEKPFQL